MPKIVDHEKRRVALAQAAVQAIAEVGIDRVRVRDVARAADCTAGALPHYFEDKDAILIAALRHVHANFRSRAELRALRLPFAPVEVWLCVLPVNETQRMEWKVWLAFASRAAHDPAIADEFRQRQRQARDDTWLVLRTMQANGEFPADQDMESTAEHLASSLDGVGLRATLDPELWPRERIQEHLESQLRFLGWQGGR